MKVTIYDIASRAGVSPGTVSKVLNNNGKLLPETRDRVLQTVKELNYQPNVAASSLKKKQTYTIRLIVPDITNPYYSALARAVEDEALLHDYTVIIASTDNNPEREQTQVSRLKPYGLDGYIITTNANELSPSLRHLLASGERVVFVDRKVDVESYSARCTRIATDHRKGGYLAATHLLKAGHRNIAILSEPLYLLTTDERLKGFFDAFRERGIDTSSISIHAKGFGIQAGHALANQIIHEQQLPTAVFASNDLIAIGAMQELLQMGVRIPDDVSMVGYDDIAMAAHVVPPLTTVAQPIEEMGKLAVQCLLQGRQVGKHATSNEESASEMILEPHLMIRSSVRNTRTQVSTREMDV
jgi:LacI family transcriptional regulator